MANPPSRRHLRAALLVVALSVAAHLSVLRAPFAWDDFATFVHNPAMQRGGSLFRYFDPDHWRESHAEMASPYRPVREIALGFLRRTFGPRPVAFHAVALAGHTANALLVYAVAWLLGGGAMAALAAALVFALHPAHVEVVAWAKNLGEVFSVFLALASIAGYLVWARRARTTGIGRHLWLALCWVGFGLGLLSKESALAVPLVLSAWAALCTCGARRRRVLLATLPLWLTAAAYLAFQLRSPQLTGRAEMAMSAAPASLGGRVVLVSRTVAEYLGLLAFPVVHSPWRDFRLNGAENAAWPAAALLTTVGVAILGVWLAWQRRREAVALVWTVAALGPAANIVVNIGRPIAEQRLYFPSAGFAVLLGLVLWPGRPSRRARQMALAIVAVLCATYAALQWRGVNVWRTDYALWRHMLRSSPCHCGPHCNLGNVYRRTGLYPSAAAEYRQVHRAKPGHPDGLKNLGAVLSRMGRFEEAAAALREALNHVPRDPALHNNLAGIYFRLGEGLLRQGRPDAGRPWILKAIEHYELARKWQPEFQHVYCNLGNCYLELGRLDEARRLYREAIRLNPDFAEAHYNLGRLELRQDRPAEALRHFRRASELTPGLSGVFVQIARLHERLDQTARAEQAWATAASQSERIGAPLVERLEALAGWAACLDRQGKPGRARAARSRMRKMVSGR